MAPAVARAAIESLLRDRKLDTTLTTAQPLARPDTGQAPSGLAALDARLDGGLPRGQVSEITGAASAGATRLVWALMAAATQRGELVALVDTLDRFDPAAAADAGLDLTQVLWVRGDEAPAVPQALDPAWEPSRPARGRARRTPMGQALHRAVKALNLVLQAGGFGLVVLDVAEVPPAALRQLPFTTWLRLQRAVEGRETACVILGRAAVPRSAGGASIRLAPLVARTGDDPPARPEPGEPPSFHAAVLASRRPFLPPRSATPAAPPPGTLTSPHESAGLWSEDGPRARRFLGLAARVSVQQRLRAGTCEMRFLVGSRE